MTKLLKININQASVMTGLFAVGSLTEVAATKLKDCERRESLRGKIAEETDAIIGANIASSFDAGRLVLEASDASALAGELAELKSRSAQDDLAYAEAHTAHHEAVKRLDDVGGDEKVARIEEERRTILEEIKGGASLSAGQGRSCGGG